MEPIVTLTMNPAIDTSSSVPIVYPDHKLRCSALATTPVAAALTSPVRSTSWAATRSRFTPLADRTGDLMQVLLEKEEIRQEPIPVKAWTRENLYVLEESTRHHYRFIMPGAALEEVEWRRCPDRISQLPEKSGYLVASGSLPPGVPDDFLGQVARVARHLGIPLRAGHGQTRSWPPPCGRACISSSRVCTSCAN